MKEKAIPLFFAIGLVVLYIFGNETLAVVLGLAIALSYVCMLFLEYTGKKSTIKDDAKINNEIK